MMIALHLLSIVQTLYSCMWSVFLNCGYCKLFFLHLNYFCRHLNGFLHCGLRSSFLTMSIHCSEVQEQALVTCDAIHRERRILLKQEIRRMVSFFADQPSLLAPNILVTEYFLFILILFSILFT